MRRARVWISRGATPRLKILDNIRVAAHSCGSRDLQVLDLMVGRARIERGTNWLEAAENTGPAIRAPHLIA